LLWSLPAAACNNAGVTQVREDSMKRIVIVLLVGLVGCTDDADRSEPGLRTIVIGPTVTVEEQIACLTLEKLSQAQEASRTNDQRLLEALFIEDCRVVRQGTEVTTLGTDSAGNVRFRLDQRDTSEVLYMDASAIPDAAPAK
jgi:hypothetical protein